MRLPFKKSSARITGLNNTVSASAEKQCTFILGSTLDDSVEIPTTALVVPNLSECLPSSTIEHNFLDILPDIPLADPKFFYSSKIDILLGGDIFPSIMQKGVCTQIGGSLLAQETVFGWILTGPIPIRDSSSTSTILTNFNEISLGKEISRFWEVEELPRKRFLSASDQYCEDLFLRTTRRAPNGRYIVCLPFKDDFPNRISIGSSRGDAAARFYRNEARLLRNPQSKAEYDNVLGEYIQLGHMGKVSLPDPIDASGYYYLPHHAVIKPESTTTKVRVVFNASFQTSNGVSLNDVLHIGPVLQNDLTILILRWRFFRFVFNGDITKMYRQILVDPKHTPFQRIIFRPDPDLPIQDYAPYLAIRTLLQLADDVKSTYPKASEILRNCMYVDDALVGAHSILHAKQARDELVKALESAGFSMRKWTANSKEILSNISPDDLLSDDFLCLDDRTALYIRIKSGNFTTTALVSSKTRVAPIKTLSIPRLELCGAALLAEMIDTIIPQLNDSTIVLSWLAKPPGFWTTFVKNCRASRGLYPQEIRDNELWWQGPHWLRYEAVEWPKCDESHTQVIEMERKSIQVNFNYFDKFEDVLDRFSSFSKAIRVISYVYRFYFRTHPNYRASFHSTSTKISPSEILMTQSELISITQKTHYPNEYHSLYLKNPISKSSPILNLNPFCDSEGILLLCGRLASASSLSYNEKHPILLPYNSQYSRLLIRFIHDISLHGGNQLVLRLVRTQFWIPKAKNLIKTIIHKFKTCVIYRRRVQAQLMSALPPERVDYARAPHMGGLWEAGVKSFKLHFRKIAGNSKYTFEEFQTLLSRIESCLNSRPLSPMSENPTDFNALTPEHFLIGSPILAPIDPNIREAPTSLLNRWQKLKSIHQHFCAR
ncbi:uncharacterized protein LOC142224584 [Haematobia irritans]|uniref:uncharacterized protein LOC142224584 n=1 Tax=Haematobia irritans TaxID=7368 RepID=UPI003F4FE454